MSTHQEAKKWRTVVNRSKNKEVKIKVLVNKITHQNKRIKVSAVKTVIKRVFMMNKKL